MADIFAEVDEAMRQEKLAKIWHEHKFALITFIAAIIIGTALVSGFRAWDSHVKTTQTEMVLSWLDAENYPQNILEQEELKLRAPLRGIALLNGAGAFMEEGDEDSALALYLRASADTKIPAETRDLATIMSLRLGNMEASDALSQLQNIIDNKKSPWQHHAKLESAIIMAHKNNDYDGAVALLNSLQDTPSLPASLYEKAQALSQIYSAQMTATPKEKTDS